MGMASLWGYAELERSELGRESSFKCDTWHLHLSSLQSIWEQKWFGSPAGSAGSLSSFLFGQQTGYAGGYGYGVGSSLTNGPSSQEGSSQRGVHPASSSSRGPSSHSPSPKDLMAHYLGASPARGVQKSTERSDPKIPWDAQPIVLAPIAPPSLQAPAPHPSHSAQRATGALERVVPEAGQAQVPVIGTWAARQKRLAPAPPPQPPLSSSSRSQPEQAQDGSLAHTSVQASQSDHNLPQQGKDSNGSSTHTAHPDPPQAPFPSEPQEPSGAKGQASAVDIAGASDDSTDAAWRWRFQRRWVAEQQRTRDAGDEEGSCPDATEDALAYLNAGGGAGWQMQVGLARTDSTDASAMHSIGTFHGMNSLLGTDMLLAASSSMTHGSTLKAGGGGGGGRGAQDAGMLSATKEVNSINRRAAKLLQQQQELEQAAEARWKDARASSAAVWIGESFETVELDDWGSFRFLVFRIRGRNDRQRILVRGKNYSTEAKLKEDMNRKMMSLSAKLGLQMEAIEVMGGGVAEWRRDKDRALYLHSGFVSTASMPGQSKPISSPELLNLAAVLSRQGFPPHYKVSIQGGRDN